MWLSENGLEATHLIQDRDEKFTRAFRQIFRDAGTRAVRTPVRSPNANAFAERWVWTVKHECLDHFVCFGRGHLDHILNQYLTFYNTHRPHQALQNQTLPAAHAPPEGVTAAMPVGRVRRTRFLGGLLSHYERAA